MHSQPTGDRADDGVDAASDGPDTRPATPERGGVDVLDLLLIRQPVVEGWTRAVRDLLADWADDNVDGDAHALLPVDGVTLATLFLDDGGFGWTDGADDAINWLKRLDRVQSWVRGETETVEAEAMYTESLLLEGEGDRQVLHYYMETEDMDHLYEAFYDSDGWEARFSEWALRRVLAAPEAFLDPPLETDCKVLIHAVDPERP
jgi:hypothetical protein